MDDIKHGAHVAQAPLSLAHMISDFYHGASTTSKDSPPRSPVRKGALRANSNIGNINKLPRSPRDSSGDSDYHTTPDHSDSDSNNNSNQRQRSAASSVSSVDGKFEGKLTLRTSFDEKHGHESKDDDSSPSASGASHGRRGGGGRGREEKQRSTSNSPVPKQKKSPPRAIKRRDSEQVRWLIGRAVGWSFVRLAPTVLLL